MVRVVRTIRSTLGGSGREYRKVGPAMKAGGRGEEKKNVDLTGNSIRAVSVCRNLKNRERQIYL